LPTFSLITLFPDDVCSLLMLQPVYLNVYDLNPQNDTLFPLGLGAFHSVSLGSRKAAFFTGVSWSMLALAISLAMCRVLRSTAKSGHSRRVAASSATILRMPQGRLFVCQS
jgi:hypothetical protein